VYIFLLKGIVVWLVMVGAAIANGFFRDEILTPFLGSGLSLPVSGIMLSVMVFTITLLLIPYLGRQKPHLYWFLGLFWTLLTLTFEVVMGHFIEGQPWNEIVQVFNVWKGNLFLLVLVVLVMSPFACAKIRGFAK